MSYVRLSFTPQFFAGLHTPQGILMNRYHIDVQMMTLSSDMHDQNVAVERMKYVVYEEYCSSILINQKDAAKKLSEAKIAFAGYETPEEIEEYLNSKTGFVNTRLSASALGLENQYNTICKYINEIDLNIYLDDFSDLTPAYKEELKEKLKA